MEKINNSHMKKILLDILIDVTDFCNKNNIKYFLGYGTLLGAVRHKGFIPWDDDIDIMMPRPDYEKFLLTYKSDNYSLFHWSKGDKKLCLYAKVFDNRTELIENGNFGDSIGINIDIFPLDGLPKNKKRVNYFIKKMQFYYGLMVCAIIKDSSSRSIANQRKIKIMKAIFKIFPLQHYINGLAIKYAKKYSFEHSDRVADLVGGLAYKEIYDKKLFETSVNLIFENHEFSAPENYEELLTIIYGNYMELPPISERVYTHGSTAYIK